MMEMYDFILKTVRGAGDLLVRLREEGFETSVKGGDPRNILTTVDLKVNEFLIGAIKKEFPGHSIYSEEGAGTPEGGEYLWAIDPIDGTSNFSRAIPHFAVCLGLLKNGVPISGAVYNPTTGELYSFKKGGGAFLNGKPIHVSSVTELSRAAVMLHAGRKRENWDWGGSSYRKLLEYANKTSNFGGSALDLCFIAAGRVEAVAYGGLDTMDIASAIGILTEAGGVVVGSDWEPAALSTEGKKVIAANNQEILRALKEALT